MFRLVTIANRFSKKVPTIKEIRQCWSNYSHGYNQFDHTPQTFFYSFLYMTHIWKATNILQIACGSGKLLPTAIQLKQNQAKYLATDLSPEMVSLAKQNLQSYFDKFESKLTFEEWTKKVNMSFRVMNGEERILEDNEEKFDRIICNCVLMLTENSEKMLKNLYDSAAPGCLMGVSVWGNKDNNNFMTTMRSAIVESGFNLPEERSNFYLYNKVDKLAQKCGWNVVLNWQQNALFPVINMSDKQNEHIFFHQISKLPQDQQDAVKQILLKKLNKEMQEKRGFNFSCQLLLLQKK